MLKIKKMRREQDDYMGNFFFKIQNENAKELGYKDS